MIAVSNTSPLSYLALLGEADLLAALFEEVWIPPEVAFELRQSGTPEVVKSWLETRPPWLQLAEAPDKSALPRAPRLHGGEEEALALALTLRPDFLLLDDRSARAVARGLGLPLMGTLAVLKVGGQRGLLDLPSTLARLARTNFRATPELLRGLLR